MGVRRKRQLGLPVGAADARPPDRDPAPAEGYLTRLVAVTHRHPARVVPALRPHHLVDLFFHQLGKDAESDTHAQREQPLPRSPDQPPSASCTRGGSTACEATAACPSDTVFFTAVPPSIFGGSPRTLPTGADEAGGTAVKFYELRDNLAVDRASVEAARLEGDPKRRDGGVTGRAGGARETENGQRGGGQHEPPGSAAHETDDLRRALRESSPSGGEVRRRSARAQRWEEFFCPAQEQAASAQH
jgi:hypothetical protein